MPCPGKENAAGVIECNASKDFVNSLICDWFCLVFFYRTGLFSSVHKVNAEDRCFIAWSGKSLKVFAETLQKKKRLPKDGKDCEKSGKHDRS